MTEDEALQVFDGAMLSDAQLIRSHNYGNAYFDIAQSGGSKHLDWLEVIAQTLTVLGAELCTGHPKILQSVSRGKLYEYCRLSTLTSDFLTFQYYRWYPDRRNEKVIPADFHLTPLSLAHWFMGDGGCSATAGTYGGYFQEHYLLSLSPAAFSAEYICVLKYQLHDLGVTMHESRDKRVKTGSGINLVTQSKAEINRFMDLVEPHIVPSFKYKCKRPMYKVNFRKSR